MAKFESGRVQMINSLQAKTNSEEACSKFWVLLYGSVLVQCFDEADWSRHCLPMVEDSSSLFIMAHL